MSYVASDVNPNKVNELDEKDLNKLRTSKSFTKDMETVEKLGESSSKEDEKKFIKSLGRVARAYDGYDRHNRKMAKCNVKHEACMTMIESYECGYNY